jgi:putative ABC transport system permease protein
MQDLRFAIRVLLRSPGFTAVAILTLALGIGLNTALFSVVNAVLLASLPYPQSNALADISETHKNHSGIRVSTPNFRDWRASNHSFSHMAAYAQEPVNIAGGDIPVRTPLTEVSSDFFPAMGVSPVLGRTFTTEKQPLAVISHGLWQRTFGGNANVIGKPVRIEGQEFTIAGVMPPGFDFPNSNDVWISSELVPDTSSRSGHNNRVIGRLKQGVTLAQAQADLDAVALHVRQQDQSDRDAGCKLTDLHDSLSGRVQTPFLVLLGAVGFVLLIACVNVANLQLAKSATRQLEISVRVSLGASRYRIIRQLLTENVVLAFLGAALGLAFAYWATGLLRIFVPVDIPRIAAIRIDGAVLLFTLFVAVITGIAFGLLPALSASKTDLRSGMAQRGGHAGGVLVSAEIALATVLLIGAGLLLQSFWRLSQVDPGFQTKRIYTADISWAVDHSQLPTVYSRLFEKLHAIPGVEAAGAISALPIKDSGANGEFAIEGRPAGVRVNDSYYRIATSDYFRALRIPLSRGRFFDAHDTAASPQVAMVNASFARTFFPGEDALGKRIRYFGFDESPQWLVIIGIVADSHDFGLSAAAQPICFVQFLQHPDRLMTGQLVVRAASPSGIAEAIQSIDKDIPVTLRSFDDVLSTSLSRPRFQSQLLLIFASVALLLAAIGIYGVLSYAVRRRTRELGIRMALGALPAQVLRGVLREALVFALVGLTIGAAASIALTRTLASFLYGITSTDPLTFVFVALTLTIVSMVAGYLPARRATMIDPVVALRYE